MKIGFDAKRAVYNPHGLGSYSRSVIEGMLNHFPENEYHAYSPLEKGSALVDTDNTSCNYHFKSGTGKSIWRTFGLAKELRQEGIDLYHGLSNEIPRGSVSSKLVVTIHDVIYEKVPKDYPVVDRQIYRSKTDHALNHADLIIVPSRATRDDLVQMNPHCEERVRVIAPICDEVFFEIPNEEVSNELRSELLLPNDFVLYVGRLNYNKNVQTLLEALTISKDHFLVIVGDGPDRSNLDQLVSSLGLTDRVIFLYDQLIPDRQQLALLYQLAYLTILPSLQEGFGLPVIESLASKTPVVCSNIGALKEASGPGGTFFAPGKASELANAIDEISTDKETYERLSKQGHEHAQQFRAPLICRELMSAYQQITN